MSLLEKLHASYQMHSEFNFTESSLVIDSVKVADFDRLYKALELFDNKFDFIDAESKLLAQLDSIFHDMDYQTHDEFERLFLDELWFFCRQEILVHFSFKRNKFLSDKSRNEYQKSDPLLEKLRSDNYFFGKLDSNCASKILDIAKFPITKLQDNADAGRFSRDDLSTNSDHCIKKIVKILNKEFKKNGTLKSLSQYMGSKYFVSGMAIELSVPNSTWWRSSFSSESPNPKTLYAHIDQSVMFPKAILYLTDVDLTNGPTSCYPGIYKNLNLNIMQELIGRVIDQVGRKQDSRLCNYYYRSTDQTMSSPRFRKHFIRLPKELRFNGHLGWDIFPGTNIEKEFLDKEVTLTGPPGTFIVFDGSKLFHRGGMLQHGKRIVLQIMFAPKPKLFREIAHLPIRGYYKIRKFFI